MHIQRTTFFQNEQVAPSSCFTSCKKSFTELLERIWTIVKAAFHYLCCCKTEPSLSQKPQVNKPQPPIAVTLPPQQRPSVIDPFAVLLNEDELKAPPACSHPLGAQRHTFQHLPQHDAELELTTSGKGIGAWLIRVTTSGEVIVSKYEGDDPQGIAQFSHIPIVDVNFSLGLYPYKMKVNNKIA